LILSAKKDGNDTKQIAGHKFPVSYFLFSFV